MGRGNAEGVPLVGRVTSSSYRLVTGPGGSRRVPLVRAAELSVGQERGKKVGQERVGKNGGHQERERQARSPRQERKETQGKNATAAINRKPPPRTRRSGGSETPVVVRGYFPIGTVTLTAPRSSPSR
jgi:hypothetical protein